jgi:uncharacterized phage protein gp47/JayE
MMTVLTSLVCTIDETGIHAPVFADILETLVYNFRGIYGQDVYLGNDSQDGQWLGILALAFNDGNAMAVAVYRAYSPATAQGEGLSSIVKINGISRQVASYSTCDVMIGGNVGQIILGGIVGDGINQWALPASVTIPPAGQILVTAECLTLGAIPAMVGTLTQIVTPTRGWYSASNPSAASLGAPVESDAALRRRQALSTSLPARTILEDMKGYILQIPGVVKLKTFENDTNATNGLGLPPHSLAFIVDGGDAAAIAYGIALKKAPGVTTIGSVSQTVTVTAGIPQIINFSRPTLVPISVVLHLTALAGYTTATGSAIQQAVADYINGLDIGDTLYLTRVYAPATLYDVWSGNQYNVTALTMARNYGAQASSNIVPAYSEELTCLPSDVTLVVI